MPEGALYYSKSRKALVPIAEMPTTHLSNAAKKIARDLDIIEGMGESAEWPDEVDGVDVDSPGVVLSNMIDELASRVPPAGS